MTIFVEVPGRTRPLPAYRAVAILGERGFSPCAIFQMCNRQVPKDTIRTCMSMARRRGAKVPRWNKWSGKP